MNCQGNSSQSHIVLHNTNVLYDLRFVYLCKESNSRNAEGHHRSMYDEEGDLDKPTLILRF